MNRVEDVINQIKNNRNDYKAWSELGSICKNQNSQVLVFEAAKKLLNHESEVTILECILGVILSQEQERHSDAEQAYRKAIELDENFAYPWYILGILLSQYPSRYTDAEQAYRKAIELDKTQASPWYSLGILLIKYPTCHAEAEQAIRKAIELDENLALPWYSLGLLISNYPSRDAEAEQAYRKAIELDENFVLAWNSLATLLSRGDILARGSNYFIQAEQAYHKAIELDEMNAHTWYGLGNLLAKHPARHIEAEQAFRKAIELDEEFIYPWWGLGKLLRQYPARHAEAEEALRKFLQAYDKFATAWYSLGKLLDKYPDRYNDAVQAYQKSIELNETAESWFELGKLLDKTRSLRTKAEVAFRKAIKLNENFANAWDSLGIILSRSSNSHTEAEQAYHKAIELDEMNAHTWYGLGNLLAKYPARHIEAEQAFRKAIELDENDPLPWHGLGYLLLLYPFRHDEAEQAFKKSNELGKSLPQPLHGLGNLLAKYPARHIEAEQAFRKAIELDENDPLPWYGLGALLTDHPSRHNEDEQAFRKAIELDNTIAQPWNGLGNLLSLYPFSHEQAEQAYLKAIELDENFADPWYGLGNLLINYSDRHDEAEQAYRKAIDLDENLAPAWLGLLKLYHEISNNIFDVKIKSFEADRYIQKVLSIPDIRSEKYEALKSFSSLVQSVIKESKLPFLTYKVISGLGYQNPSLTLLDDVMDDYEKGARLLIFADEVGDHLLRAIIHFLGGDASACFQILDKEETVKEKNNFAWQYYLYRSAQHYFNSEYLEVIKFALKTIEEYDFTVENATQLYYAALLAYTGAELFPDKKKTLLIKAEEILKIQEVKENRLHYDLKEININRIYFPILILQILVRASQGRVFEDASLVKDIAILEHNKKFLQRAISSLSIDFNNLNKKKFSEWKRMRSLLHSKELLPFMFQFEEYSNFYATNPNTNDSDDINLTILQSSIVSIYETISLLSVFDHLHISDEAKKIVNNRGINAIKEWKMQIQNNLEYDNDFRILLYYPKEQICLGTLGAKMEVLINSHVKLTKFEQLVDYFRLERYISSMDHDILYIYARICLKRTQLGGFNENDIKFFINKLSEYTFGSMDLANEILSVQGYVEHVWNATLVDKIYAYIKDKIEDKSLNTITIFSLKEQVEPLQDEH